MENCKPLLVRKGHDTELLSWKYYTKDLASVDNFDVLTCDKLSKDEMLAFKNAVVVYCSAFPDSYHKCKRFVVFKPTVLNNIMLRVAMKHTVPTSLSDSPQNYRCYVIKNGSFVNACEACGYAFRHIAEACNPPAANCGEVTFDEDAEFVLPDHRFVGHTPEYY